MNFKKILAGAAALTIVSGVCSAAPAVYSQPVFSGITADAADTGRLVTQGNITYYVTSDHAEAVNCSSSAKGAVVIPETVNGVPVTVIDENTFNNCIDITSVKFPTTLVSIFSNAFINCEKLTSVTLPKSLENIGIGVFTGCNALEKIAVEEGSKNFVVENNVLFDKDMTTLITYLPTKINKKYTVPETVETIQNYAFANAVNLETIELNEGLKFIKDEAFIRCSNLTALNIPASVEFISTQATYSCSELASITVAKGNTAYCADNNVLYNADKTQIIRYAPKNEGEIFAVPSTVEVISGSVFDDASLTTVTIGKNVKVLDPLAFMYCNISEIMVSETNPNFTSLNGVVYNKDATRIKVFPGGRTNCTYTIPVTVTAIEGGTFSFALDECTINIPSNVTVIDEYAFQFSQVKKINILPNESGVSNLKEIGDNAFYGCYKLEKFTMPDGVKSIGKNAFSGCEKLSSVFLPETVSSIGSMAFWDCVELNSIVIPNPDCKLDTTSVCAGLDENGDYFMNGNIYGLKKSNANEYADNNGFKFVEFESFEKSLGDIDHNGAVDSGDASKILAEYAAVSTGDESELDDVQKVLADVTRNGSVDSSDASMALAYYSYVSTGGEDVGIIKWQETVKD